MQIIHQSQAEETKALLISNEGVSRTGVKKAESAKSVPYSPLVSHTKEALSNLNSCLWLKPMESILTHYIIPDILKAFLQSLIFQNKIMWLLPTWKRTLLQSLIYSYSPDQFSKSNSSHSILFALLVCVFLHHSHSPVNTVS